MYFVQRPTPLFHTFFMASSPAEYIVPSFDTEEDAGASKKSDPQGSAKQHDESKPAVTKQSLVRSYRSNANVTEQDDRWIVCMDMPGVKADDVSIAEKAGVVNIEAERENRVRYVQQFSVDPKKAILSQLGAELTDGVLKLTIPKKAPMAPVAIPLFPEEAPEIEDTHSHFTMDLPGVSLTSLKLEYKDDNLFLHAERKRFGRDVKIERVLQVGSSVDIAQAKGYLSEGVLTVIAPHLPGNNDPETHMIKVEGAKSVVETVEEGA